jgi:hydrogenase maturation protease
MATKLSVHQIDLGEVFAVAELRGHFPPEVVAIGIEPEIVQSYVPLSLTVRQAVPELIEAVERQLRAWGHELEAREALTHA